MTVEYLERDHEVFRSSPERLAEAARAVLELGLSAASGYRLEVDADRLEALLGEARFSELLAGATRLEEERSAYDVYEGELDPDVTSLLPELLTPVEGQAAESPLNYIRSVRLLDESGRGLVRLGSQGTFLLFALPPDERRALSERLAGLGLPEDVAAHVDVDLEDLQP